MKDNLIKETVKHAVPLIMGLLIASYIFDGKENYVLSVSKTISSIIGGLLAGYLMAKWSNKMD